MAKATQFCVGLDNKPGTLAKLCGALKRAKVNIDAISVADNIECGWIRMVATPTAAVREALTRSGFSFCTQRVLLLTAVSRPGELEHIATRLGKVRVNINYVYGSGTAGASSTLVLHVNNLDRAVKALGE